jgi:hypothetical protein
MPEQINRDALDSMSADEIATAHDEGRLRAVLTGRPVEDFPNFDEVEDLSREDLAQMDPSEITKALDEGRLDDLLGR